jgi:hypothetical protein
MSSAFRLIACIIVLGACQTMPSSQGTQAPSPTPRCTALVRGVDLTTWREVSARGFTFCVPPEWTGSGNRWRSGEASVTWGTGVPPQRVGTATMVIRAGETLPDRAPDSNVRTFTETIGDAEAKLYSNRFGRRYFTAATWRKPAVYLEGESDSPLAADLQLRIYRTVRFTAP